MTQALRIGRTLALVLPIVLVLSGTLAVAQVPWATAPPESQVLASAADEQPGQQTGQQTDGRADAQADGRAEGEAERPAGDGTRAPHLALQDRLVAELQEEDPGAALTSLQRAVDRKPSLAEHCMGIARELGRAAVLKYGSAEQAGAYARPVCDTSFAAGVTGTR